MGPKPGAFLAMSWERLALKSPRTNRWSELECDVIRWSSKSLEVLRRLFNLTEGIHTTERNRVGGKINGEFTNVWAVCQKFRYIGTQKRRTIKPTP